MPTTTRRRRNTAMPRIGLVLFLLAAPEIPPSVLAAATQRDLQDNNTIRLAGILDTSVFDWAEDLFSITIRLLNQKNNGFFDEELRNIDSIEHVVLDAGCDSFRALSAYFEVRENVNGLVGARCSGASMNLGWIGALDNVAQIPRQASR